MFSFCVFALRFCFVFSFCVFALCFRFVFSFRVFVLCFHFVFSFDVFAFRFRFKNTPPHNGPISNRIASFIERWNRVSRVIRC